MRFITGIFFFFINRRINSYWDLSLINSFRISRNLSFLRIWFIFILIRTLSLETKKIEKNRTLKFLLIFKLFIIIIFFNTSKIFFIYFIFELSLIPIFLIIIGWGYQIERFQARIFILFYTFFASLPLFFRLLYIQNFFLLNCFFNLRRKIFFSQPTLFFLRFLLAFLVKRPIFFFHSWLPKAHVEAPVFGSIVLAALLLKLGTYGIYLTFNFFESLIISTWVIRISLTRILAVNFLCLRLIDIKVIIALSSVSHIGIVVLRLSLKIKILKTFRLFIILAHGISSSLLFIRIGIIYNRCHSRLIILCKGITTWLPIFRGAWFLVIFLNIAGPPRLNLLRELGLILGILNYSFIFSTFLFFGILFRTSYSLIIFRIITQKWERIINNKFQLRPREILRFFRLITPGIFRIFLFYLIC